jgi:hypothetical protein
MPLAIDADHAALHPPMPRRIVNATASIGQELPSLG